MTTKRELRSLEPTEEQVASMREIQEIFRRFAPEGVSLADELIAERRSAAKRE